MIRRTFAVQVFINILTPILQEKLEHQKAASTEFAPSCSQSPLLRHSLHSCYDFESDLKNPKNDKLTVASDKCSNGWKLIIEGVDGDRDISMA